MKVYGILTNIFMEHWGISSDLIIWTWQAPESIYSIAQNKLIRKHLLSDFFFTEHCITYLNV